MCDINIIKRRRGEVLLLNGYQYYKLKNYKDGGIIWRCALYRKSKCVGSVTIINSIVSKAVSHLPTCSPDYAQNEIDLKLDDCKKQASASDTVSVPKIYRKAVGSLENRGIDIIKKLPQFSSIKSTLYRQRNQALKVDKLYYKHFTDIKVPSKFHSFLLADYYRYDDARILVFASTEARNVMTECDDYFSDGTFGAIPEPFLQLYTIHCDQGSSQDVTNIIPVVYAFLPDKTKDTYITLLQLIKSQIPHWNPKRFKTDYEDAMIQAIRYVFPRILPSGCYYHYCESLKRKTKSLKLKAYRIVSLCKLLPLLPRENIMGGWSYVIDEMESIIDQEKIEEFKRYMNRNWLSKNIIERMCVFGQRHRTTNYLESWHFVLNGEVGKKACNLHQLLNILVSDASYQKVRSLQVKNKINLKKRDNIYIERDRLIQNAQMQLINGDISVGHFLEKLRW